MKSHTFLLVGISGASFLLPLYQAQAAASIYSSGHGDIGAAYDAAAMEFEPHWHLHSGAVVDGTPLPTDGEYAPDEMIAMTISTRLSPTGLLAGIGIADGSQIYAAGSSAHQPNLGFGVEELDINDWTTDITVTLTAWTLPTGSADLALFLTNIAGTTVTDIVFSTHDSSATTSSNSFTMTPGDHTHFRWGFTQPGTYTVELTWAGTHKVDGAISTTESFDIMVVPEPSSVALLGIGLGAFSLRRRR